MARTTGLAVGPRHVWTEDNRIVLFLLHRLYMNSKPDLYKIWHKIHRSTLIREGFTNGTMAMTALTSQFAEQKRTQSALYKQVFHGSLTNIRSRFRRHKDLIEDTAQILGITLSLRVQPALVPQVQHIPRTTLPASINQSSFRRDDWSPTPEMPDIHAAQDSNSFPNDEPDTTTHADIQTYAYTGTGHTWQPARDLTSDTEPGAVEPYTASHSEPERGRHQSLAQPGLSVEVPTAQPPRTPSQSSSVYREVYGSTNTKSYHKANGEQRRCALPVLLFRAFDPDHGLTARAFLNGRAIPRPPKLRTPEFRRVVEPHLFIDENYLSPFISFTESIKRTLDIIEKSEKHLHLAIVLFNDLEEEGMQHNKICPQLVPTLCRHFGLELPGDYVGFGEWLVWGAVDSPPVLVLDYGQASELLRVIKDMKTHGQCIKADSEKLAHLFHAIVDKDLRGVLLRTLVKKYHIRGCDWSDDSPRWVEFSKPVYRDTESEQRLRRQSSSQPQTDLRFERDIGMLNDGLGDLRSEYASEAKGRESVLEDHLRDADGIPHGGPINDDTGSYTSAIAVEDLHNRRRHRVASQGLDNIVEQLNAAASSPSPPPAESFSRPPSVPGLLGYHPPVSIDLTRDVSEEPGMQAVNQPRPNNILQQAIEQPFATTIENADYIDNDDVEMVEPESEDDIVVLGSSHRALSIRSRSFAPNATQPTPTRRSRFPQNHVQMLH